MPVEIRPIGNAPSYGDKGIVQFVFTGKHFLTEDEVAKLIGAPPGYVGYEVAKMFKWEKPSQRILLYKGSIIRFYYTKSGYYELDNLEEEATAIVELSSDQYINNLKEIFTQEARYLEIKIEELKQTADGEKNIG